MKLEKLSNLLDISMGKTPARKKTEYWGEGYKWASIRDLSAKTIYETKEQITIQAVKEARCKLVSKGTLLFSFKLTIGKMAFAGCDLYTNEAIAAFVIKDSTKLKSDYLYYALKAAKFVGANDAAMGKTLNSKSLAEIQISLPSINDQVRIAYLLGKVEGLIAQRKQQLQQLDELLKSVFLEMFGDPVRNEKEWDKPELKKFGKITTGNTPPRKDLSNYSIRHIEWIKTGNIPVESIYITKAVEYLSKIGESKGRSVTSGALLVACIAGSIESIGRAALTDRTVTFNQQINAIQPSKDVNSFYLYVLFKISKAYVQGHATKGMKKILSKGDFEQIRMIKPPIDLQNKFAKIAERIETAKSNYNQSLIDLENLYGALSQQAFKGELDLSRVPLSAEATQLNDEKPTEPEASDVDDFASHELDEYPMDSLQGRAGLLQQWFSEFVSESSTETTTSLEQFWQLVQLRSGDYSSGELLDKSGEWYSPRFETEDYDQLKTWIFNQLEQGHLQQVFDEQHNQLQLQTKRSPS